MTRISNIAVEFQISSIRIIETLKVLHPNKNYSINEKLDEIETEHLRKEFTLSPNKKINRFKQADFYTFEIDDEFYFSEKEITKFDSEYVKYVGLINDIENLKFKNNKYWGLDQDEINAILRIKYSEIENIQSEIEKYREELQEKLNKIRQAEDYEDDLRIHSEAKSIESWNID
jgi:hypothetical protein